LDVDDHQLETYVFERNFPYKDRNYTKDGIHLMWPQLICEVEIQHLIRNHVIENGRDLFSSFECCNQIEDIVDRSVISTNNWLMYGCSKPNLKPYSLTHVYNGFLDLSDLPELTEKD
jgi:hypothetical protein